MRYPIFDLEVTKPIPDLSLSPADAGVAILVRRKGTPVGFWMQETKGAQRLASDELARRISVEAGEKIAAEAIFEELASSCAAAPLPLVTVAICTKDRPEGVERLLSSLSGQAAALPAGSAGLEILIVDNAPSDERTRELAARHPEIRYVRENLPGLNFARNRALREASGEFLAFLDDDVMVDRYWSAGLAAAWAANPDAAAFTGQVLPMELETEAQIIFEKRCGFRHGFDRIRYGTVLAGNSLFPGGSGIVGAGANMAFRTGSLRKMGGFDEALDTGATVPGGGDLDIFYRVIRAGHALVYEPRFMVFHQHRREMKALFRQYRRSWGLGFMCYVAKCRKSDPAARTNLLRLTTWWFSSELSSVMRTVKNRMRGKPDIPPSVFIVEIFGGVVGLFGGYSRSVRRTQKIRKRHA